ncbi:hypothetical protein MTO96_000619 [Rhipicephalus appendiculatus]
MRKAESMSDEASSAKKVRVEDQAENTHEKTSTYSLSDEDIDCEEEADSFTQVTYKKRRFEGIPVVFRPIEETRTFWKVNPNVVASEIVALAKEKVRSFRVNKDGSFSVTNKAASLQHQHDIIYGRTQQRGAPEPNMNTMNPARPPRPQEPKHQDPAMTYAQAARGQRNREQSVGTSTSQHQARQESQERSQEKSNHVVSNRQSTSTSLPCQAHPFLPNLDTSASPENVLTTAPRGRSPTLGDGWRRQRLLSALVLLLLCGAAPVARCAETTAGEAARRCLPAAGGGEAAEGGRSEFPTDLFSQQQRQRGWVALHFAGTAYGLALLAIVCQKYFVPSLEVMADHFRVPTDVAGATFMAMGTSAPELFSSVFGLFVSEGDIGVSTVLGSAVFNIVGVTGVIGLIVWKKTVDISWYPVTRDCIMFAITVLALVVIVWDNSVAWWEAMIMLLMFILYIVYMSFDSHISKWSQRKVDKLKMFRRFASITTTTLKPADEKTPLLTTQTIIYVEQDREEEDSSGIDSLGSSSVV